MKWFNKLYWSAVMPLKRQSLLSQSRKARHNLEPQNQILIPENGVLLFATLRNEMERLELFLNHYRALGVAHFVMIDNGSTDGSSQYLAQMKDVSLWCTEASYRQSRFGMLWMNALLARYGHNRWCLTVDIDELLVLPSPSAQNLCAFTAAMERLGLNKLGALMIDLFPKGPLDPAQNLCPQEAMTRLRWFDPTPYRRQFQEKHQNMWIQGGIRARTFFPTDHTWPPP